MERLTPTARNRTLVTVSLSEPELIGSFLEFSVVIAASLEATSIRLISASDLVCYIQEVLSLNPS